MSHSPPPAARADRDGDGGDTPMSEPSPPVASRSPSNPDEPSARKILADMQSENVATLEALAALATSGEIRDYDELFTMPGFYSNLVSMLRAAWKFHDLHHLGNIGGDQHENFLYEQELASAASAAAQQRRRRTQSGVDDEEDEDGDEIIEKQGSALAQDQSWKRLQACYVFLSRVLAVPEFDFDLARKTPRAFDSNFAAGLVGRFEPKFRRKSQAQTPDTKLLPQNMLTAVTGAGGVAIGSKVPAQLAHVPASILSMVGIGVKYPDPDSPTPAELNILRGLLHTVYKYFFHLRATIRNLIAAFLQRFLRNSTYPQGLNEILNVYGAIVKGFGVPLAPAHVDFLNKNLLPLHQPNQMLNELSPVLSNYHESIVYVLIQFLEKDAATAAIAPVAGRQAQGYSLCEMILTRILLGWPNAKAANSPKEVLLLHECEKILEYCPVTGSPLSPMAGNNNGSAAAAAISASAGTAAINPGSVFHRIIIQFLPYLIQCISSYNHRVSARALQLWQNDKFLSLCASERGTILPQLLPCLVNEEKHWNQSVNKMRGVVLQLFRDMDLVLFTRCAHEYYLSDTSATPSPPVGIGATPASHTPSPLPPNFTPADSLARIDALIAALKPPEAQLEKSAEEKLLETQVRVAAHLPQQIKYSDFVFGHLLGEGSFSQVRYAKWIQRGGNLLPSQWPEFAVKIINKELVAAQNYAANLAREIAIMNLFAHENINRLVGVCENATNTYLVLEYAPKGDLHNHITTLGSLDVNSARFVAAEILRALEEIHKKVREHTRANECKSNGNKHHSNSVVCFCLDSFYSHIA
jgi:hypothetical protein